MPRYEAKKEQKNPNGFRKSIDGSHYYRIGWDSIKAIKLLPNPQKKNCLYIFSCSKTQKVSTLLHLSSFYFLFFRFVFFFTIFDDEGPRSDEGWILPPHSKRFNHITSKELDKNRQTLRLVCVCEQQILLCFFEKKKSRIHVRCQQTYCVYHSNFFFPPSSSSSSSRLSVGWAIGFRWWMVREEASPSHAPFQLRPSRLAYVPHPPMCNTRKSISSWRPTDATDWAFFFPSFLSLSLVFYFLFDGCGMNIQ